MSTTGVHNFLQGLPASTLSQIAAQSNLQSTDWQHLAQNIGAMSREQLDDLPPGAFSPIIDELDGLDVLDLDNAVRKVFDEPWFQEQNPNLWDDYMRLTTNPDDHSNVVPGQGGLTPGGGGGGGGGGVPGAMAGGGVVGGLIRGRFLFRGTIQVACLEGHLNKVTIPTDSIDLVSGRLIPEDKFPAKPHQGYYGIPIIDCPDSARWEIHNT